ncbi:hypothetical protein PG987_002393 [Apiospora arundinis]
MVGTLLPPVQDTHGIQLPPRYTIRPIDAGVADWAKALAVQGFLLGPSIRKPLMAAPKTRNAMRAFDALGGYYMHAVNSGLSYGVFDSEYEFARPQSKIDPTAAAAPSEGTEEKGGEDGSGRERCSGALYWNELDPDTDPDFETGGGRRAWSMAWTSRSSAWHCRAISRLSRRPTSSRPSTPSSRSRKASANFGETATPARKARGSRRGPSRYAPAWVTALNHFVMLDLKAKGFRAMNAGIGVPSVYRNWMNAPTGCKSHSYLDVNIWEIEVEDEDGRKVKPYADSGMAKEGWLMWCDLKA